MINVDVPITVVNMETLTQFLDDKVETNSGYGCEHAGFVDLHEPEIMPEFDYRQVQFKKYGYEVRNVDDTFWQL